MVEGAVPDGVVPFIPSGDSVSRFMPGYRASRGFKTITLSHFSFSEGFDTKDLRTVLLGISPSLHPNKSTTMPSDYFCLGTPFYCVTTTTLTAFLLLNLSITSATTNLK